MTSTTSRGPALTRAGARWHIADGAPDRWVPDGDEAEIARRHARPARDHVVMLTRS